MAPHPNPIFSPSELAYLHSSLALHPPIRPDGRSPTTFRPLSAETDIVEGANGSARVFYEDGTEAIVGVKGEVQRSFDIVKEGEEDGGGDGVKGGSWVEVSLDVPGARDDDNAVVFLAEMLKEGLVAGDALQDRLYINRRWHWKLYIDIILLTPPQTQTPSLALNLPLLSLTTHLALLTTRLPALVTSSNNQKLPLQPKSNPNNNNEDDDKEDEDPIFNDDWATAFHLYPPPSISSPESSPAVSLLLTAVEGNIFFDPSNEELAVADVVVAVTIARTPPLRSQRRRRQGRRQLLLEREREKEEEGEEGEGGGEGKMEVVAVRMIDPPSRGYSTLRADGEVEEEEGGGGGGGRNWKPKRGGVSRDLLKKMVGLCTTGGGVGEEVLSGMAGLRG